MASPIGVGIIGAGVAHSWAAVTHVPAIQALPDFELKAVCTSRRETADEAARTYGVPHGFDDYRALVAHPEVDLVVVTVKVPTHLELVTAATEAGKHVYCEWPLGNGLTEAETLAALADERGVRNVVGLQAQASPQVWQVRDLVAEGYVGKVLSSTLVGSGGVWGAATPPHYAYLDDRANGATLITIPMGHTIDALCTVLGDFTELAATAAIGRPLVELIGTDQFIERTAYDQVALTGRIGDAVIAIHYRGGSTPGTNFLWEINGTDGVLQLTGESGSIQAFAPTVRGARGTEKLTELPTPEKYRLVPSSISEGPAFNVAQNHALFARDLKEGTALAPDFAHAVRNHRLLERIEAAIETGQRWVG